MAQEVQPAYQVIPLLEREWTQDPVTTAEKFRQFIRWHEHNRQPVSACLYRCALVQLKYGYGVMSLNGLGFDERTLMKEAGV